MPRKGPAPKRPVVNDPVYGARPLKRYVQQAVETPLAKELVGGKIRDGQTVIVDAADDRLQFRTA